MLVDQQTTVENEVSGTAGESVKIAPVDPGKIRIRAGQASDKEPARALLKQHHDKTIFGHLPFSDTKFDRHAELILSKPDHVCCFVAEFDNQVVGLIWATAGSYLLSDEGVLATVHVLAVDGKNIGPIRRAKTFRGLLSATKQWADSRGADHVLVHVTTGTNLKATDRLLRGSGGRAIGGGYLV